MKTLNPLLWLPAHRRAGARRRWTRPASPSPSAPQAGPESTGLRPFSGAKRLYDIAFSVAGLVLLAPLLLLIAVLIRVTGRGGVLYRQTRIGQHGQPFELLKFRTMVPAADRSGPAVTRSGDQRITRIGRVLRKTKLDELPQLWNVLKGEMSLVGPRPEVPEFVDRYTPEQREILRLRPGITDLASLCFREEEALLAQAANVEEFYLRYCVPRKLALNRQYAGRATLLRDTWIILQTLCPYWVGVLAFHALVLTSACGLAASLVHGPAGSFVPFLESGSGLAVVLGLQLALLTWRKQCLGLLSYFGLPELKQMGIALGLAAALLALLRTTGVGVPPLNFLLVDALLALALLGGSRHLLHWWRERTAEVGDEPHDPPKRVGIIGAGNTGTRLALELTGTRRFGRTVVAFFDDDVRKWRRRIHEIPVVGMPECLLDGWPSHLDEVVIAMPGARAGRLEEIVQLLSKAGLKFYTVPCPVRFWDSPRSPGRSISISE